ncbi:glycosyl transferase [Sinomonas cyclohexanicum]|uniref:Glycosyl transferase n=1 Tax=Sinomonas cyclohexanicum TaxID=322009 RepID=A0ABN6FJN9_SINCY|nr:glycosyltransferase [Corynebacterium cyclohexanicum]BCT77070.1 glycosyl transferase [Corynebacterium cyclohexanicum]
MSHVTVVVPCFNDGATLAETLRSALAQTHTDLDVVVVDDGSTDAPTRGVLAEVSGWNRVSVIHQANMGPAGALNTAIKAASGPYILPLGADDIIAPPYVAKGVAVLDERKEVGMVYCRAEFFGSINSPWGLPDFSWRHILIHNLIFATSLFRKSDWAAVGGYDEVMRGREDHDFVLKILARGLVPFRLDGVHFFYRRGHKTSVNDVVGADRKVLIDNSARMMRNNLELYGQHAEDLFDYIFRQQDEINDLRYRYAWLERLRDRNPNLLSIARVVKARLRALLIR